MGSSNIDGGELAGPECGPCQVKVTKFIRLLIAALHAYIEYIRLQRDRHLDALEDRLDALASGASASDKLLMERVAQRIERERKRPL